MPGEVNVSFLKKFKALILDEVKKGSKFLIIIGGGGVCRMYQKAAFEVSQAPTRERDWLGIEITKVNAMLLKSVFGKKAHPQLLDKRGKVKSFGKYSIIIGCGWEPGCSTDFDAIQAAIDFKQKLTISLGKPDYVYTANPDQDKSAKPIPKMTWAEYFKLIPSKWTPGFNSPVDPIAARLARKNKMKVILAGGADIANFKNILRNKPFKGTLIED